MAKELPKTEEEWQKTLDPEQYAVCRKRGTETPFSGKYNNHSDHGVYKCVCCGEPLFASDSKFDAGCGWPSFSGPVSNEQLVEKGDHSHGMNRTEVTCANCDAHLGHVFNDGPAPSHLRYCINSVSLDFDESD